MIPSSPKAALDLVRARFGTPSVLVVGDLMLDRHVFGEVSRISPEAPVPILRFGHQTQSLGGAGNVARNLIRLGCRVALAGIVGTDSDGDLLLESVAAEAMSTNGLYRTSTRRTTVKTRVIGGRHQMLRIDAENQIPLNPSEADRLLTYVHEQIRSGLHNAVLLSDYSKGVLSPSLCCEMIDLCRATQIPILIDPKGHDFFKYRGATGLTPNLSEFSVLASGCDVGDLPLIDAARFVVEKLELEWIVVTRSEEGMTLVTPDSHTHVRATSREVFDVSGAGDSVIAVLTAALLGGMELHEAVRLANLAAGLVVGRVGIAAVNATDLEMALAASATPLHHSICSDWHDACQRVSAWKAAGETVVFTNGCFDILHAGHVVFLERSRREGSKLIVGLNSDASVKRLKGCARPVNSQDERALVLSGLGSVDAVVLFDEDTPLDLIQTLQPDILTKGSDYSYSQVVGREEVESWGGYLALIPLLDGISTTAILKKITGSD